MPEGRVKWFNVKKGYGFIKSGADDVFVHKKAVKEAGCCNLYEDQKINYDIEKIEGKIFAVNLKLLDDDENLKCYLGV